MTENTTTNRRSRARRALITAAACVAMVAVSYGAGTTYAQWRGTAQTSPATITSGALDIEWDAAHTEYYKVGEYRKADYAEPIPVSKDYVALPGDRFKVAVPSTKKFEGDNLKALLTCASKAVPGLTKQQILYRYGQAGDPGYWAKYLDFTPTGDAAGTQTLGPFDFGRWNYISYYADFEVPLDATGSPADAVLDADVTCTLKQVR